MSTLDPASPSPPQSLVSLQKNFQDHLIDPDRDITGLITETSKVPKKVRLAIYSNAYRVRLVEASAADYNHLQTYLGDEAFDRLIRAYLSVHPSRHFSLRWFGQHLSDFLRDTPPYNAHADLHELALFEWALCNAFDAPDAVPVGSGSLTTLSQDAWITMKLAFHPSLQWIALRSNAPRVWSVMNDGQAPPPFEFQDTPTTWLVWRKELRTLFRSLDEDEAAMMEMFHRGETFADVCDNLCTWHAADDVPVRAASLLRQWVNDGLVKELVPSTQNNA